MNKKRIKHILIIAAIAVAVIGTALVYANIPKTADLSKSKIYNQETVKKQAEKIITLINEGKYDEIEQDYANQKLQETLTDDTIPKAKKIISKDWGSFKKYSSEYTYEIKQFRHSYAVAEIKALYDNVGVTYRISFDENMKLAGLYLN